MLQSTFVPLQLLLLPPEPPESVTIAAIMAAITIAAPPIQAATTWVSRRLRLLFGTSFLLGAACIYSRSAA